MAIMEQITEAMKKSNQIIHSGFGGLGDNLMFSTLPERFTEIGHDVYISEYNPVRNQEIYDLVWGANPYVKGKSTNKATAGMIKTGSPYHPTIDNFIQNVELMHDLEPRNSFPKIYRDYHVMEDVVGKALVDLTAITRENDYDSFDVQKFVTELLKSDHGYKEDEIVFVLFPLLGVKTRITHYSAHLLPVMSLTDYADLIHSCKTYVSLHSGGNMLATAIKAEIENPNIICLIPERLHAYLQSLGNQALFSNNIYIKTPQ